MALPPSLANESAYAGDPYDLRVIVENTTLGTKTFTAQARSRPEAPSPAAEFQINAYDGTGADAGDLIIDLSLSGLVTAALPQEVFCDLEQKEAGSPLTLLRWKVAVQKDVTR